MKSCVLFFCCVAVTLAGCKNPNDSNSPNGTATGVADRSSLAQDTATVANSSSLSETTVGGVLLKPFTLLDGKLELLIPADFEPMKEELLQVKYPNANRPKIVYTSKDTKINIAANHTKDRVAPSQLSQLQQQLDRSLRSAYPKAKWNFNGKSMIAGREWIRLDLVTPAADTRIRNIMMATSADNRVLMVTINVTEDLNAEWAEVAEEIIKSIKYRD